MKRILYIAVAFVLFCAVVPLGVHAQYHITPNGTGDGSNFENAAPLSDLPRITQALNGIGGDIIIHAGTYNNVIAWVNGSGTANTPIIIHGLLSNNPNNMPSIEGADSHFLITNGVANVHITDLRFRNCDICIRTYGTSNNITIEDILAENVGSLFESGVQNNEPVTGTGYTFNNVKVEGYADTAIRFIGDMSDIAMDRIFIQANPEDYNGGAASYGAIEFRDSVRDVTVRRTTLMNRVENLGQLTQPNTDGFWAGPGTSNIAITDSFVAGYTDGGLDFQSQSATITRVTSVANRSNFIFEQSIPDAFIVSGVVSLNPSDTQITAIDNGVDTIIARISDSLFEMGPAAVNPNVPTGAWVVDSYRCAIVVIEGGVINHRDGTQATRVNDTDCGTGTEKGTFTNVELGPQPEQVVMPPVPDNTTVGRFIVGDDGEGVTLHRAARKHLQFGLFWYAFASVLYVMIIHFAFAIRKQFSVHLIAGLFVFGAVVGWFFGRYEIGFILAVLMSLLFW